MRAVSLFLVLLTARVLMLAGAPIPVSIWSLFAYVWQDALVALIIAVFDRLINEHRAGWVIYGAAVLYIALNVPIARVLSSPLTPTMLRAAGGPLADSIRHHLTVSNIAAIALVVTSGVIFPFLVSRMKMRRGLAVAAIGIVAIGPIATTQVDTLGFHRNAFGAILTVGAVYDRPGAHRAPLQRISPFESEAKVQDLSYLRAAAAGRNVVLIALESTAAMYLAPYGASEDPMPNLSRIASQSVLFENAYAVYPESIKALASTFCSQYPQYQGKCLSVAQILRDSGYRTALFHSGRFMYLGMEEMIEGRGFDVLEDAGAIGGNVNSSFGVDEPATIQRILGWIDTIPRDQRFFISYLPIAGHHPYATPDAGPFPTDTELGRYKNALHYGDATLGELFDGFVKRGLADKTLFVIFGDHGEAFGQHPRNYGHTLFIYEENIRVPYIVAAPGLIQDQTRVRRVASLIDTPPTVLDLLGIPIPSDFQGSSLLDGTPRMALFYTDYSIGWLGLRDGCWKYIFETDARRSKLFDICRDATEKTDLSRQHARRVATYRTILEKWVEH